VARIIYVEDELVWLDLTRNALIGHQVDSAGSFREAVALIQQNAPYDLALIDLNLEEGDDRLGGEILDMLKMDYPSTHRIVVTGHPPVGGLRANILDRYGVEEIIIKGHTTLPELRKIVTEVLSVDSPATVAGGMPQESRGSLGREAVVVLCAALDVEYQAIREHIPEPVSEVAERGSLYEIATVPAEHATWKAILVLTDRDNTPAAVQVERAIATFRPQVVLFVGVAGGRRDARIGDVVAASAIYGYEAGMDTNTGPLARIKTMPSSFWLVQQAHAVVRQKRWMLRIKPAPPAVPPAASVRPLAAGTKVVTGSSSQTARWIDANCGDAQGVEMEGFGVLQAAHASKEVDALVIRGISDLFDEKDKVTDRAAQPAAARNAAAFAIELLLRLKLETPQT
jgi:nucleoside phosphorylase/CheY-like chemotaxis protein